MFVMGPPHFERWNTYSSELTNELLVPLLEDKREKLSFHPHQNPPTIISTTVADIQRLQPARSAECRVAEQREGADGKNLLPAAQPGESTGSGARRAARRRAGSGHTPAARWLRGSGQGPSLQPWQGQHRSCPSSTEHSEQWIFL